jgi:3-oxoacyl-[acyl-carrier protein] reductase
MLNKPFESITEKEVTEIFHVNFNAPFMLIQESLPCMSPGSHIVNIGSMGGLNGTAKFSGLSVYSSSKGALGILTECLAEELKSSGISVNCLALGAVQTEMLTRAFPGYKAPLQASQMAEFIVHFSIHGHRTVNGKVLPVSLSTP